MAYFGPMLRVMTVQVVNRPIIRQKVVLNHTWAKLHAYPFLLHGGQQHLHRHQKSNPEYIRKQREFTSGPFISYAVASSLEYAPLIHP